MRRLFVISVPFLALTLLMVAVKLVRGAASASAAHSAARTTSRVGEPRRTRVTIRVPGLDLAPDDVPKGPPGWLYIGHVPEGSRTLPCEVKGLGPVLVLRHYLSEKQWASLTARGDRGPILARFEIVDAQDRMPPPYPASDLPRYRGGPYNVTAILYWADVAPADRASPLATYLTRVRDPAGETIAVQELGPLITRVRAEWVEYTVSPKSAHWEQRGGQERLAVGDTGWVITGKPHIAGEGASRCGWAENVAPIYDLSISRPTP